MISCLTPCHSHSVDLLKRNLTPGGISRFHPVRKLTSAGIRQYLDETLPSARSNGAVRRSSLARAATGLQYLPAEHQAPNGQIATPSTCKTGSGFLVSGMYRFDVVVADLRWRFSTGTAVPAACCGNTPKHVESGYLSGFGAGSTQRFNLPQANEASDWAGHHAALGLRSLYERAVVFRGSGSFTWHAAKTWRISTGSSILSMDIAEYRRARLLNEYVLQQGRTDLYLSFVNFAFFGEEGDVFGNVLAVLLGLADRIASKRT